MKSTLIKLGLVPVLAIALVMSACSEEGASPEQLLGPTAVKANAVSSTTRQSYRLIREAPDSDASSTESVLVHPRFGGLIHAPGGHSLFIPVGSVDEPTRFVMTVHVDGMVRAELRAYQRDAAGQFTVDVGAQGFRQPVHLILSYKGAEGFTEAALLRTLWVRSDGTAEEVISQRQLPGFKIEAKLLHFSDYAVGFPNAFD